MKSHSSVDSAEFWLQVADMLAGYWQIKRRYLSWTKKESSQFNTALKKMKIKFSSYIRKFRVEQLQSHTWLTAVSYMGNYLRISSYIRKPFLIYDLASAPIRISLYIWKIWFSFYQCAYHSTCYLFYGNIFMFILIFFSGGSYKTYLRHSTK